MNLLTGIILAGGEGTRFGGDKALVKINGDYLIDYLIKRFKELFNEIIISTNNNRLEKLKAYNSDGVRTVYDLFPSRGPLVGLYSSLKESTTGLNFVSACDMPFINGPLVNYMIEKSKGYDAVIPSLGKDKLEPLRALYKKTCLRPIKKAIEKDKKRVISFYTDIKAYILKKEEIIVYDPRLLSFVNINTQEDLKKVLGLFRPSIYTSFGGYQS